MQSLPLETPTLIKFVIITRRRPDFSREQFFYEWAFIHVSLMLHTAPSMRRFKRYVQHFANPDIPADCRALPPAAMAWECISEHWIERFDPTTPGPEYTEQMLPHKFSDSAMEIAYLEGRSAWQRSDFHSGGIKLVHRLARRADLDDATFRHIWQQEHLPLLLERLRGRGLRKLEVNVPHDFDPAAFHAVRKGSLLEQANIEPAAGFEELWFDRLEDALQLGRDAELRNSLSASYARFADVGRSWSMIANERVVFDYVNAAELSPPAAVLDPTTLDSQVFRTGRPYHEPRWIELQQRPGLVSSRPGD
jgi:EthD domain